MQFNMFVSSEMVNLDSYDSEGPLTPETDDSTEVRSEIIANLSGVRPSFPQCA